MTNPDMLNSAILPHHTKWFQLFEQLKVIVVDELHTYRGVFGSHVANVLRRLRRHTEAATAYREALTLATTEAERRYLTKLLAEVSA